jgi:hypothetical protein
MLASTYETIAPLEAWLRGGSLRSDGGHWLRGPISCWSHQHEIHRPGLWDPRCAKLAVYFFAMPDKRTASVP